MSSICGFKNWKRWNSWSVDGFSRFDESSEEKKPTVQVGDPFTEKLDGSLFRTYERYPIISIQDMGAAGLTSSSVEMASKGDLGIELDLDKVPCREENMTPYEMMLSESRKECLSFLRMEKSKQLKKFLINGI